MTRYNMYRFFFGVFAFGVALSLFFLIKTATTPFFYDKPYENKSAIDYPYEFILHNGGIAEFRNENGESVRYYIGYVDNGCLYGSTTSADRITKQGSLKNAFVLSFEIQGGHIEYVCYEARREIVLEIILTIVFGIGASCFANEIRKIKNPSPTQQNN